MWILCVLEDDVCGDMMSGGDDVCGYDVWGR